MPNELPPLDTGLIAAEAGAGEPPNIFVVCCGELDDNDVLTEFAPKRLAVVLVVGIVLAL